MFNYQQEQEEFDAWVSRHDRFDGFDRGDLDNDEYAPRRANPEDQIEWEDIEF